MHQQVDARPSVQPSPAAYWSGPGSGLGVGPAYNAIHGVATMRPHSSVQAVFPSQYINLSGRRGGGFDKYPLARPRTKWHLIAAQHRLLPPGRANLPPIPSTRSMRSISYNSSIEAMTATCSLRANRRFSRMVIWNGKSSPLAAILRMLKSARKRPSTAMAGSNLIHGMWKETSHPECSQRQVCVPVAPVDHVPSTSSAHLHSRSATRPSCQWWRRSRPGLSDKEPAQRAWGRSPRALTTG
ncbi:hypothetical protein BD413DRAFT_23467 [Trametes elegans]|nr:hypothetical protein BD413DRAFT_23467 [Trametes elegans]